MPNKERPRCPTCSRAMGPVFRKSERGRGYPRIAAVFWCERDGVLARGRSSPKYLFGPGRRPSA